MAKLIDLKPPVFKFTPVDDSDPAEVDVFNEMIRKLRDQGIVAHQAENEPPSPVAHWP